MVPIDKVRWDGKVDQTCPFTPTTHSSSLKSFLLLNRKECSSITLLIKVCEILLDFWKSQRPILILWGSTSAPTNYFSSVETSASGMALGSHIRLLCTIQTKPKNYLSVCLSILLHIHMSELVNRVDFLSNYKKKYRKIQKDGSTLIWILGSNVQNKFENEFYVVTVDINQ